MTSFLPMLLVSSIKYQSKLPKSLLVGVPCFNSNVTFHLKSADLNDFSLKLMKYSYALRYPLTTLQKVHFVAYEQKDAKIKIQAHIFK